MLKFITDLCKILNHVPGHVWTFGRAGNLSVWGLGPGSGPVWSMALAWVKKKFLKHQHYSWTNVSLDSYDCTKITN